MKVTREEQKAEALKRMQLWGIIPDAIKQFKNDDKVMVSEQGMLYWLNDEQAEAVKKFEEQSGALVYMVIRNKFEFGECWSMLYVSDDNEKWEYDIDDITEGYAFVYVKNIDDDTCSEYGTIGVKARYGGLVRTQ